MTSLFPLFSFFEHVGMDGHTPSSQTSLLTAACPGSLLSPAQTQTHISHIPQPPQAPGAASQLGAKLGCSLPPWCDFHHLSPTAHHIINTLKRNISFFHPCIGVSNCTGGEIVLLLLPLPHLQFT